MRKQRAGGTDRELSNGLALSKDMKLIPDTFAQNYQDEIISQALDCHFDAEEKNFLRPNSGVNPPKINAFVLKWMMNFLKIGFHKQQRLVGSAL